VDVVEMPGKTRQQVTQDRVLKGMMHIEEEIQRSAEGALLAFTRAMTSKSM
jgi:hypothetical protein